MRSNKPKTKQRTSPLSFMFVLTFTASVAVTGVFGLYPNNPITQQYRTVLAHNIAPEFLAPVNGFLGILNVSPIPEDQYQPGDGMVFDPGGWLLEQLGFVVPPLYGPDSMVVVLDPAGALFQLFGVDVAALPETSTPFDPAASIFQWIGLTLPPEPSNENPPDPAGTFLAFLFPGYDLASEFETPLDPGGILLAWLIPGYQPPPINNPQNPPPDPGGQLLALFVSPQLFGDSNIPLNPGGVIFGWLFPTAPEPQLPAEQDIVDAAMTSVAETQTYLASLPTDTSTPTLTPTNTPTFTPTNTLTPTLTVSPVILNQAPVINPPPANNPAATPTITPSPTDTMTPFLGFSYSNVDVNSNGTYTTASPGESLLVSFDFNIYNDPCPGCQTQLVTGLGTPGSHGSTCAFDGDALPNPGSSGLEEAVLIAPMTPGIYSVVVEYYWEPGGCTNALALYGTGSGQQAPSQTIATIEVQAPIILYEGAEIDGNIGTRAVTDATCATANTSGYANARAFIAYSNADSISNMPINYGVPTTIPIQSISGTTIANDWSDLMDGSIAVTLSAAGVTPKFYWWSGVASADGTHVDGVTNNCSGWISNLLTAGGSSGDTRFTDTLWMLSSTNAGCSNYPGTVLLCIAYP